MATHDYVLDNATGANFRADLNNALAAIVSNNSSSTEPSTKYAYQWWADTHEGVLKIRNSANDGWVTLLQLDGTLTLEDGSASAPALGFRDDLNTGIFSSAADTLDITCGGTTRGSFSSSGLTVTGTCSATTLTGTLSTAAQTNVTSLGTLTGLTLSGDMTFTGDSANIVFDKSDNQLEFADNAKAEFGTGGDLEIFHNGSQSKIIDTQGNELRLNADTIRFRDKDDGDTYANFIHDGAVELYYDNTKRFETTSSGVEVFGELQMDDGNSHIKLIDGARIDIGSSADLQIFHSGGENFIRGNASTSALFIDCCNELQIRHLDTNGQNSEKMIVCNDDGAVELYHDNSKKLETISGGITVTGGINTSAASTFSTSTFSSTTTFQDSLLIGDNVLAKFGTGSDFRIYHDGTDNRFDSSGLKNFIFRPKDTDIGLKILGDGAVEAYFDGNKKFETLTDGVNITGTLKVNGSAFSAGGGKVVQQVSVVKTDTASNSTGSQSTWEFNDSSLRVQITGSSTNNKFMFIGQVTTGGEISTHIGLRDGETSSNVTGMMATGTSNRRASTSGHDHGDSHSASTVPIIGVISVPDTNQHTYYYQFSHTSGGSVTLFINRGSNSGDNAERGRYISSLTVLEIEP